MPTHALSDLVFLCAGRGVRVGLDVPKQFVELGGKPVMIHSLAVFEQMAAIGQKIIVHEPGESDRVQRLIERYRISNCVLTPGGVTRQQSVRQGLALVRTPRLITHNAAVALITAELVEQVMVTEADCVTTATTVQDNMVRVEHGRLHSIPRQGLQVVNSPQSFRTAPFQQAHEQAAREGRELNSDAELMLHYGHTSRLVPGPAWSFKITDRVDLALAETILKRPDLFPHLHYETSQSRQSETAAVAL